MLSSAETERIAALIHIADGTDLMLSSPPAIQQKLFAVRCVRGYVEEDLADDVREAQSILGRLYPENRGTELEDQFRETLRVAQDLYDKHMSHVKIVVPWLRREDPALYEAAANAARAPPLCGCAAHDISEAYTKSLRAWIESITPEVASKRRRVTLRNGKKSTAESTSTAQTKKA